MIMSIMGRQLTRSSTMVHHQRLQHSDDLVDVSVHNKWLHSSNLLHDYKVGSRSSRNLLSSSSATPFYSRSYSMRSGGDCNGFLSVGPNSGLLDFDTELLPQAISGRPRSNCSDCHYPSISNGFSKSYQNLPENRVESLNLETSNVAKIKVVVRKRPLNKKERGRKGEDIIIVEPNSCSLTVNETKLKVDLTKYVEKHEFVFDAVLDQTVSNEEVYSQTVEPLVPLIFHRTKATCFAYGQTGSGKTYTMQPLPLRASQDMLWLMLHKYQHQGFRLYVSFFEIYGGKLFDLLNGRRKLCTREDGKQSVCIVGLQEYEVSDVKTIRVLVEKGNATRSMGTTGENEESSRSHAILQLAIKKSADGSKLKLAKPVGKLSFIDLAGSERGADTYDNDKQTRLEGAEINKSLLALKECIRALDNDQAHIPFRGSKLTEVLRDSFIGDSRTVMISCISPSSASCENTLNTLRYADRVKSLTKGSTLRRDIAAKEMLNEKDIPCEIDRVGRETSPPSTMISYNPTGRTKSIFPVTPLSNHHTSFDDIKTDTRLYSSDSTEEKSMVIEKDMWIVKREFDEILASDMQSEDLNFLLKEEDDLIKAHQMQVEETLDIVREEMNLLSEADKPENNLIDYIFKLNAILTQKAAGILELQTCLVQFHRHLNEQNVLASSNLQKIVRSSH